MAAIYARLAPGPRTISCEEAPCGREDLRSIPEPLRLTKLWLELSPRFDRAVLCRRPSAIGSGFLDFRHLEILRSTTSTDRLQRLQVLDDQHSFLFGQLAADHAVALWTGVEFMPCIRIAGQIGAELSGAFEGLGIEAKIDGVVLLVPKVKDFWPIRNR